MKTPQNGEFQTDDEARQWSTNDVLDAFHAAAFPDHDAAIIVSLMVEQREHPGRQEGSDASR